MTYLQTYKQIARELEIPLFGRAGREVARRTHVSILDQHPGVPRITYYPARRHEQPSIENLPKTEGEITIARDELADALRWALPLIAAEIPRGGWPAPPFDTEGDWQNGCCGCTPRYVWSAEGVRAARGDVRAPCTAAENSAKCPPRPDLEKRVSRALMAIRSGCEQKLSRTVFAKAVAGALRDRGLPAEARGLWITTGGPPNNQSAYGYVVKRRTPWIVIRPINTRPYAVPASWMGSYRAAELFAAELPAEAGERSDTTNRTAALDCI